MKSSKLHSTQAFAATVTKTKHSPERYQCIRKQENSTETQALAIKTQMATDTICHEMKRRSTDGHYSPRNKKNRLLRDAS
jgi:hypothetical protein